MTKLRCPHKEYENVNKRNTRIYCDKISHLLSEIWTYDFFSQYVRYNSVVVGRGWMEIEGVKSRFTGDESEEKERRAKSNVM